MSNSLKYKLLESIFRFFGRCSLKTRIRIGSVLNVLAKPLLKRRLRIIRTNLKLCFPNEPEQQREAWTQQCFRTLVQSVVDRGLLWYGSPQDIRDQIQVEGEHYLLDAIQNKEPIILLAPHFIGLDVAATRLTMDVAESATIYTPQHDPDVDLIIKKGRARFNLVHLISRKEGVRGMLRFLKRRGIPVYYLPDMDFGRKGSVFVPFFNIPTATLPTTAHLAHSWHATIIPVISRWNKDTGHYTVTVHPPLQDFPGDRNLEQATAYINELLEQWILQDPTQYYWVHRRFKTRPDPETPSFYK